MNGFTGPRGDQLTAHSQASDRSLQELTAVLVKGFKEALGADPEATEQITMAGVPAVMLTHHFMANGVNVLHLDAHCVRDGRMYEIYYTDVAGNEAQDRAFFLAEVASFTFLAP